MKPEFFKTLVFTDERKDTIGKYAQPVLVAFPRIYKWGGTNFPLLMSKETNMKMLKIMYEDLDFEGVELITKKLTDV